MRSISLSPCPLRTAPMPVMNDESTLELSSGAGLIWSLPSSITSDNESTTAPTTRPRTFSTTTTVKVLHSAVSPPSFRRRSMMGTMTPRRLTTPLTNEGELAMRMGCSYDRISCTCRTSMPYSSVPRQKVRNSPPCKPRASAAVLEVPAPGLLLWPDSAGSRRFARSSFCLDIRVDPGSVDIETTSGAARPWCRWQRSLVRGSSDGRRRPGGFSPVPPRAPGPWAEVADPAPGGSGSSRSPVARAQRPWRSPGTDGPQDRLCPGSPRRMAAMIFGSPPQFRQCCMSMSKAKLQRRPTCTQVMSELRRA
jgi:hypothetical protein